MNGIITTKKELKAILKEILPEIIEAAAKKPNPEKLFTVNQTARKLEKTYQTIRRMIDQNRLQATADGKNISQQSIDNYLTGKNF